MIAWKYCSKCGKIIELDYYPFNKTISEELMVLESEHAMNLCDTCANSFSECNARRAIFGDCVGNDNVIECDAYRKKEETKK